MVTQNKCVRVNEKGYFLINFKFVPAFATVQSLGQIKLPVSLYTWVPFLSYPNINTMQSTLNDLNKLTYHSVAYINKQFKISPDWSGSWIRIRITSRGLIRSEHLD